MSADLKILILLAAAIVALMSSVSANSIDQTLKELDNDLGSVRNAKYVAVQPSSLIRYLFGNARYPSLDIKRGGRSMDALSGVVFGKRSELLNLEPVFGRYGSRFMPRMSDMRWAPFDSYDSSSGEPASL